MLICPLLTSTMRILQSGPQGLPVWTEPLNLYNRFGSMGRLTHILGGQNPENICHPYSLVRFPTMFFTHIFGVNFLKIFCTHMRWSDSWKYVLTHMCGSHYWKCFSPIFVGQIPENILHPHVWPNSWTFYLGCRFELNLWTSATGSVQWAALAYWSQMLEARANEFNR